ncbi:MAG: helix-turn-helix domain-containing protein [Deltaproteobacteria bacterium]|nr:MAG: helix-turn-helix domain-containing protein [Deltaproteobacteria bacterium]
MSSHGEQKPPDGPASDASEREPSIGTYLARQRRLRGISLEELQQATRVPLRSLERLERGAFDEGIDGFTRGFVKTVASALGLDPDATLARMLVEPDARADGFPRVSGRTLLFGLALAAGVAGASGLVWLVRSDPNEGPAPEPASVESELVYRRDPVRELAESELPEGSDALASPLEAAPSDP